MACRMDIIERDGTLGYLTTDEKFVKMTNWAPRVVGMVKDGSTMEGCLVEHPPSEVKDNEEKK